MATRTAGWLLPPPRVPKPPLSIVPAEASPSSRQQARHKQPSTGQAQQTPSYVCAPSRVLQRRGPRRFATTRCVLARGVFAVQLAHVLAHQDTVASALAALHRRQLEEESILDTQHAHRRGLLDTITLRQMSRSPALFVEAQHDRSSEEPRLSSTGEVAAVTRATPTEHGRPQRLVEIEARTAELHEQLAALDKDINALKEGHVPCPDTIAGLQAEAQAVGKQLYDLRKGKDTLEDESCEASCRLMQGTPPPHFSLIDRWIFHARTLCPSYNPHKLAQVFSAAHLHGYTVIRRRQGALMHLQSKSESAVAPLAFTVGLSVPASYAGPRRASACAALPFEILLYGYGQGEVMARCIHHLEGYMATRALQREGLTTDVVETHEILDEETGYRLTVSEDRDVSSGLLRSSLALAGLFYQLCMSTADIGHRPRRPVSQLPRLVQVYLEAPE